MKTEVKLIKGVCKRYYGKMCFRNLDLHELQCK